MKYIILEINEYGNKIYGRIDDDGIMRTTCTENHQPLLEWIAEGNTPEDAD